ncbi:hypothetical protein [Zavarzinella formosa]|uniref:hypothetical protein n=1 Tax=Zavarzinella formosa TaxID=360055 RepID=UPI000313BC21|nr:hypothetical protein [Zavarzinella formosa]
MTDNKPSHTAFSVRDGKDGKTGRWTDIGVAFATKDGRGFIIHLNSLPLDGRVILREADRRGS